MLPVLVLLFAITICKKIASRGLSLSTSITSPCLIPVWYSFFFIILIFKRLPWSYVMIYLISVHVFLRHITAQKWKGRFLTGSCHKIYRVEVVGLSTSNYTFKIPIFVNMWNLGPFREKLLIFCTALLKFEFKNLLHLCDS